MPRRPLRGNRLVLASNQMDRGATPAPRRQAEYWCANDHLTTVPFAADVDLPEEWLCYACGRPAGPARGDAPKAVHQRVFPKSPYEFVMMRRTEAEADRLLAEAVAELRARRRKNA